MKDVVQEYIDLKTDIKTSSEKLAALETVILKDHREDERIKIVAPRKTIVINADTYENLKSVGVQTQVTETRNKVLKEFDIEIQKLILENEDNFTEKLSKESIRINSI